MACEASPRSSTIQTVLFGRKQEPSARDRILSAASELFYMHGVNGVGIDAVVERAGVAKASLYGNFRGKDDLVRAVLEAANQRDIALYGSVMEAAGSDPRDRVDALFEAIDTLSARPEFRGCAFVNAGLALPDPAHPAHEVIKRHKRRLRDLLIDEIEGLALTDPATTADTLLLLIDGALTAGALRPDEHPALRARDAAHALLDA
jgi:AcrR family transcriptional regulator